MATITIEIDDKILADFWDAVGAYPDPSWTQEQAQEWRITGHLEPFIARQIVKAGAHVRRTRATDAVVQSFQVNEDAATADIAARMAAKLQKWQEKAAAGATAAQENVKHKSA